MRQKKKKKMDKFWSDNSSENLPELKNIKLFQKNLKFVFFNFCQNFTQTTQLKLNQIRHCSGEPNEIWHLFFIKNIKLFQNRIFRNFYIEYIQIWCHIVFYQKVLKYYNDSQNRNLSVFWLKWTQTMKMKQN